MNLITNKEKEILRKLAEEYAGCSQQQTKADLWKDLNDLIPVRPLVHMYQIPWHEMDVEEELKIQTIHPLAQKHEEYLRRSIYQWKHMRGDMVLPKVIFSPLIATGMGFGINEQVDYIKTDEKSSIASRHYHIQITSVEDAKKIRMPEVRIDWEQSEINYQEMSRIFNGILPVQKRGFSGTVCNAWDELIRYTGVTEGLMALYTDPQVIHSAISRLMDAYIERIRQLEDLGVLASNNGPFLVGNGGYGYSRKLPSYEAFSLKAKAVDMWGGAMAQIFAEVSPAMHEEFALFYEKKFLRMFGLNYYGCCDPLHKKMDLVFNIPNIRKVSVSPWADTNECALRIGSNYVYSYKPSPSYLAEEEFNVENARKELVNALNHAKQNKCNTEVILKDISTVKYDPKRLWKWADMASETVMDYQ